MKAIIILICTMAISLVNAQTFTDKIVREIGFEKKDINNALLLANINGAIDVSGYDGEKIRIEVTRTIKAKTLKRLEQAKAHADSLLEALIDEFNSQDERGSSKEAA